MCQNVCSDVRFWFRCQNHPIARYSVSGVFNLQHDCHVYRSRYEVRNILHCEEVFLSERVVLLTYEYKGSFLDDLPRMPYYVMEVLFIASLFVFKVCTAVPTMWETHGFHVYRNCVELPETYGEGIGANEMGYGGIGNTSSNGVHTVYMCTCVLYAYVRMSV